MVVGTQLTSGDFLGRLLVHPFCAREWNSEGSAGLWCRPGERLVPPCPARFIRRVWLAAGSMRVQAGDHIRKIIEGQVHSYVAGMVRRLKNALVLSGGTT